MAAITPTDVFDFCSCKSDVRTTHTTQITDLIARKTTELEEAIGRKVQSTTFTDIVFQNGVNCEIHGQKLFLKGIYRDIYSITSITEENASLSQITGYEDGNDYYFDANTGILHRKNRNWSQQPFAIKISGKLGLVNTSTELTRGDVKDVLIEMVAAKSGLWVHNVRTADDNINTVRTSITEDTKKKINKLKIKGV